MRDARPWTPSTTRPIANTALVALGMLAVFCTQYAWIRPTNFGGADEWLLLELASRGVLGIPYANRPLLLVWFLPAARLAPHSLVACYLQYGLWIALSGWMVVLLCRRLVPGLPMLWLLAGTLSLTWVPEDYMRLDVVLLTGYAGLTLGALLAVVLFVESVLDDSLALLVLGGAIGLVTVRGFEGVLPLLLAAPFVLAWSASSSARRFRVFALLWEGLFLVAALVVGLGVLGSSGATYQSSAFGFDPAPWRVAWRLLRQFGYHLLPLVTPSLAELLHPGAVLSAAAFLAVWTAATRSGRGEFPGRESRRSLSYLLGVGLAMAALAYAPFCLTGRITTAARTQMLAAPGVGILLAAAAGLAATWLPPRWRRFACAALAAWVVALGTARTVAMQRDWDASRSRYPEQHRILAGLTRLAPAVKPHTLFILVDDPGAFQMSFTFRHAIQYLYPGQATGVAPGGADFLYPTRFGPQGVVTLPWPVIRLAWVSPPTLHRYDETIVVRPAGDGVEMLEAWPFGQLPPLPPGAGYDPRSRLVPGGPAAANQRILSGPGAGPPPQGPHGPVPGP